MDLPTVKASVKAWEKKFKADNKRDPTKEDIKADPSGIAEQYSLYRRLSKSSTSSSQQSQSQSQAQSRTNGSSIAASQRASSSTSTSLSQSSRVTPRTVAASEYPTTPTPPTRRSSGRIPQTEVEEHDDQGGLQPGPSTSLGASSVGKSLKRTASKAALNGGSQPTSPASRLLTTPKKRPYTGPIHDPNPINPFAASPLRRSAMKSTEAHLSSEAGPSTSPFMYASSPKKLKELLQETSARRVQQNSPIKEVTPRTKARKRLTGEMDETPVKSRVRRKRGAGTQEDAVVDGTARGSNGHGQSSKAVTSPEAEEEEDTMDDEFGPTPIKPARQQESFYSLFEQDDGSRTAPAGIKTNLAKTGDMVGRLLAASASDKGKQKATESTPSVPHDENRGRVASSPDRNGDTPVERSTRSPSSSSGQPESELPPWADEEDDLLPSGPDKQNRKSPERPEKTLTISDDEIDEWDPEASHVRHRVKIVPTRSRPIKKRWSDEDDDDDLEDRAAEGGRESAEEEEEEEEEEADTLPPLDDATTSQSKTTITSPPPLLSLLSLTSPNHRQGRYARLKELRYKALFNPSGSDARKLKAFQKGQEAFVSGETDADDETAEFDGIAEEEEGNGKGDIADDDWESESEGWKRTGVEMDDDAW